MANEQGRKLSHRSKILAMSLLNAALYAFAGSLAALLKIHGKPTSGW
jgi:hypothetical protein